MIRNERRDRRGMDSQRLPLSPARFFGMLHQFTGASVVIRSGGVSLFYHTQFGIFFSPSAPSLSPMHLDPVSGLEIDFGEVEDICYLNEDDSTAHFEIDFAGMGFSLAIFPETRGANDAVIDSILSRNDLEPVATAALHRRGASDWLGERFHHHGRAWHNDIAIADSDDFALDVKITMTSPGIATCRRFQPDHVDRDAEVWRVAERRSETVAHFSPSHSAVTCASQLPLVNRLAEFSPSQPPTLTAL